MLHSSASRWLFSRATDLGVFAGATAVSLAVAALAPWLGADGETPPWAWLVIVVGIDVAHVWSTLFRVYLDGDEVARRPVLAVGAPLAAYSLGVFAHALSSAFFWTALAYVAVWHFVRQQVGWMVLYGRKAKSDERELAWDRAALYAATLGPVVWWHANLPRPFWWFREHDFVAGLPSAVGTVALALHFAVVFSWLGRHLWLARERGLHAGKLLLVTSTFAAWFFGIVVAESDLSFTVTNVVMHGVPYLALTWRYSRGRLAEGGYGRLAFLVRAGVPAYLGLLFSLAWLEELGWDRLVWHEHEAFFGSSALRLSPLALSLVVPLLATPQLTHYLLDGLVWRTRGNPQLAVRLGWRAAPLG